MLTAFVFMLILMVIVADHEGWWLPVINNIVLLG